jgi:CRISPR-associated protein Cas1
LGEILPHRELDVLRGIEGARMKTLYATLAQQFGIDWKGRRYDRQNPEAADAPNQAINHAATAVEAAASIAVTGVGALPQLGFIHEDSGIAFVLDIADLYRGEVTLPVAFGAVRAYEREPGVPLERHVRRLAGAEFRKRKLISAMIDRVKELFDANVRSGHS